MKVLLVNGSPHKNGNTALALREMEQVFTQEGIEVVTMHIGAQAIRGCAACGGCGKTGKCVFDDAVNEAAAVFKDADGLVLASPVYYAGPNATLTAFADRLFFSTPFDKTMKVGASVVCARRGGTSASFDRLNKYFTIMNMPVVSSQYWNMAYGQAPGQAAQDEEGMQTMRTLGRNMAWVIKKLNIAEDGHPQQEQPVWTNFIK